MNPVVFFLFVVIIYLITQLLKRWEKLARHETFNAIMNAGVAYCAIVGVLVFFSSESSRLLVGGLVTLAFWVTVTVYFSLDYRKNLKKRKPIKPFPLTSEKKQWVESHAKPTKLIKRKDVKQLERFLEFHPKSNRIAFAKRMIFFVLEVVEVCVLIAFPVSQWQVLSAITYQNVYLVGFFIIGILLAFDVIRRLYHLKKYHSE